MLESTPTTQFKKDLKRFKHNLQIIKKLNDVIKLLAQKKPLPRNNADHPLGGGWIGSRECHVSPDVLLIYRIDEKNSKLFLERFGSHAELF